MAKTMMNRRSFLKAAAAAPLLARADVTPTNPILSSKRNILLIIADDCGVDQIQRYVDYYASPSVNKPITATSYSDAEFPKTPTLEKLGKAGVTFVNAWSSPVCSPARACLYTGNHSFRHGVYQPGDKMLHSDYTDTTIAKLLKARGYATGLFGKWHLAGKQSDTCPTKFPVPSGAVDFGWDQFVGSMGGDLSDYDKWDITAEPFGGLSGTCWEDVTINATYTAYFECNLFVQNQINNNKKWMAVLAFNAPHDPWTKLAYPNYGTKWGTGSKAVYRSMLESVDKYIDSLLNNIPDSVLGNTTIIFMGDNGTPVDTNDTKADSSDDKPISDHFLNIKRSKGSIYEGGIKVPLIIADGYAYRYGVQSMTIPTKGTVYSLNTFVETPVNTLDLFATCAEIGGAGSRDYPTAHDSKSLIDYMESSTASPQRTYVFAESKSDAQVNASSAKVNIRDVAVAAKVVVLGSGSKLYKLIVKDYSETTPDGDQMEMYNLTDDPWEAKDLLSKLYSGTDLYAGMHANTLKGYISNALAGFR